MVRLTFSEGLVLMAVCLCFILPFSAGFSWKSCSRWNFVIAIGFHVWNCEICQKFVDEFFLDANPDDDVIQVKELKVSPDILSLDGSVTLSLQVDVKRDLNGTLQAKTEIQKSSGVLQGQSIPCQGKFGSWWVLVFATSKLVSPHF